MPIYAYKCDSCGYAKDVLQKMSDATLVDCPQCGASAFKKQLTAAGFQLKGSGWYVTDFKGGAPSGDAANKDSSTDKSSKPGDAAAPAGAPAASATAVTPATAASAPSPAPASTPASSAPKGSA